MDKKFYNKIIKLIPSDTLKEFLKSSKFRFDEKDLLLIINDCARNYAEKMTLLQEVAVYFENKAVIFHAKKLIELHKRYYDDFMSPNENCVYEIYIITDNNFPDERRFITKTFEDAIILLKRYKQQYRDGYVSNSIECVKRRQVCLLSYL